MSEPTITDMFTGEQKPLPRWAYAGEPSAAWVDGWNAGMDGEPKTSPAGALPSEVADWIDGYEAAERG